MKKHKGSGNRGGKGMAGSGKRADHRKSFVIKYLYPYFGKQGFTSRSTEKKKNNTINVGDLENFKENEINLEGYKLLGDGEIKRKVTIKVDSASKSAVEKIEKAGGKVVLKQAKIKAKEEKKPEEKQEKKKEEKKKVVKK